MHGYMFDTNIFNDLLDGAADLSPFIGKEKFYATHIQLDELKRTRDETRRELLVQLFEEITNSSINTESAIVGVSRIGHAKLGGDSMIATESAVYGVSAYGQAKYTSADNLCQPITQKLDGVKKKPNNIQDALIAETAIKNGLTLVTHDKALSRVATEFGCSCINIQELTKALSEKCKSNSNP